MGSNSDEEAGVIKVSGDDDEAVDGEKELKDTLENTEEKAAGIIPEKDKKEDKVSKEGLDERGNSPWENGTRM